MTEFIFSGYLILLATLCVCIYRNYKLTKYCDDLKQNFKLLYSAIEHLNTATDALSKDHFDYKKISEEAFYEIAKFLQRHNTQDPATTEPIENKKSLN